MKTNHLLRKCVVVAICLAITFVAKAADPTTSAPTPTAPANKVASIFSDAYQSADPGTVFFPNWSQPTVVSTIQVGGTNNVLKYDNFSYEGTQLANILVVPDMKYMHVDVYTSNLNTLKIGPISPGPQETDYNAILTANTWNSFDIPVSTFTGVNMSDIIQLGTSGGNGAQTVYLDNIYFWTDAVDTQAPTAFTAAKGTVAGDAVTFLLNATDNSGVVFYDITYGTKTATTLGLVSGTQASFVVSGLTGSTDYSFSIVARDRTGNAVATPIVVTATTSTTMPAAPTPTRPAAQVKSIYSDAYTPAVTVTEWSNWWMMNFTDYVFPGSNNGKKAISTNSGGCGSPTFVATPFNATGMKYMHVDVYPITSFVISTQVITITTTDANWVSLGTLTPNQWNSIDVPVSSFTNLVKTDIKQVGFQTTGTPGTFYMDNLYFYTDATGISEVAASNLFKCYPSQIVDNLTIKAESEISNVTVRNLLGQTVKTLAANGLEKSIDLSAVAAGNYFVTVRLANGQLATQKIIKQ